MIITRVFEDNISKYFFITLLEVDIVFIVKARVLESQGIGKGVSKKLIFTFFST